MSLITVSISVALNVLVFDVLQETANQIEVCTKSANVKLSTLIYIVSYRKSSQVTFIYIALYAIEIV